MCAVLACPLRAPRGRLRVRGWRLSFPPPHSPLVEILLRRWWRVMIVFSLCHRFGVSVAFRPLPAAPCLGWGRVSWPLPLSGSCARCAAGRAGGHAAIAALATLGTAVVASLPFFFGYRFVLRLGLHGVSPRCGCPRFAAMQPHPTVRRIHSFCGGSCRPLPPLFRGGLSRPALPRTPSWAVFFIVST